jgi:integrase
MERGEPEPVVAPTWAEADAAIDACRGWHKQLATFLRYSGLRVGETMLLLWSDVDMERGELRLRKEIIKTGPGRTVPLSAHLLDELATWGTREPDAYVIPSGRREGARERLARPRDLERASTRAGVRKAVWEGRPFHVFRKAFKSNLLAAGAAPDHVDWLQGHSLGGGRSSRGLYIDGSLLPLQQTLALIPPIGTSTNVVQPRKPKGAAHSRRTTGQERRYKALK